MPHDVMVRSRSGMVSALIFQHEQEIHMAGSDKKLTAKLVLPDNREVQLPVMVGTEDEHAIDVRLNQICPQPILVGVLETERHLFCLKFLERGEPGNRRAR